MKQKICKLKQLQDDSCEPNRLIESIPETIRDLGKRKSVKCKMRPLSIDKIMPDESASDLNNQKVSISLSMDDSKREDSKSQKDIHASKTHASKLLSKKQIMHIEIEKIQKQIQNPMDRSKEKPKESWKKPNIFQNNALRQIVKKQKIQALVRNFISKIHRSNMYSEPIQFNQLDEEESKSILYFQGIQLNQIFDNIFAFLSIIQILTLFFLYTLSLVYDQIANGNILSNLQSISVPFYIFQMILNLITVKNSSGKKLTTIIDIWRHYYNHDFWIHFISLLVLVINLFVSNQIISFVRLIIILKLPECLQKMEKLEVHFIKNFYNEQYWSLVKVFLFNFCFAHILAIFLTAMTSLNDQSNWMINKGLQNSNWYEKYIWSYYWGTTIMLTVGFGDLVATTYQQALCLIFIETFSCIVLAYNVSCVGTLISNIRAQDLQKSKNFKIFKKLSDSNFVNQELTWKVNNYIEQTSNLKKKFNYQQQNQFIDKLPLGLKRQYLKESNKKIFENLTFFKALVDKTLYNFAQKIQMHISHPEEIVRHFDDDYNLMILKVGELAYTCKKPGCGMNEKCVDFLKVEEGQQPRLTSLLFIQKKRPIYEIKSLEYSTLYVLDYQKFINILKETQMDFQLYALLRDKIKNIPDQFQVNLCELCKGRHFKFTCPKLHFIPYQQQVANRYIYLQRTQISQRKQFNRGKRSFLHPFLLLKKIGKNSNKMAISMHSRKNRRNGMIEIQRSQEVNAQKTDDNLNQIQTQIVKLMHQNQRHMQRMTTQYESHAKQFIKNQFNKFFKAEAGEDQVWEVSIDRLKDFNGYFQTDNPSNLHVKFDVEIRGSIEHKLKSLRQQTFRAASSSLYDQVIQS